MDRGRVLVPAVGLIVTAGLDALFAVALGLLSLLDISMLERAWTMGHPIDEEALESGFLLIMCAAGLAIDAIIAYGGIKMMRLESYGFAIAAALLAIIPCISSPCIVLGIPFGIWSLFVLMDPEVRSAFMKSPPPPKPVQE